MLNEESELDIRNLDFEYICKSIQDNIDLLVSNIDKNNFEQYIDQLSLAVHYTVQYGIRCGLPQIDSLLAAKLTKIHTELLEKAIKERNYQHICDIESISSYTCSNEVTAHIRDMFGKDILIDDLNELIKIARENDNISLAKFASAAVLNKLQKVSKLSNDECKILDNAIKALSNISYGDDDLAMYIDYVFIFAIKNEDSQIIKNAKLLIATNNLNFEYIFKIIHNGANINSLVSNIDINDFEQFRDSFYFVHSATVQYYSTYGPNATYNRLLGKLTSMHTKALENAIKEHNYPHILDIISMTDALDNTKIKKALQDDILVDDLIEANHIAIENNNITLTQTIRDIMLNKSPEVLKMLPNDELKRFNIFYENIKEENANNDNPSDMELSLQGDNIISGS
ncbi:hypothetical protein OCHUTO_0359 [Orientia chuto str. Dubai]|uniref:Uncharacterized protein n=1 Tax=Orientia chuto str. Dubai TaxID=1359168 RepID=A0A0F3MLV9_9RICK|nr:hypothetical protein [Candidatus Orientia mediorientalis]KJV56636.1 hypothetical protein OCHUTO_0359 [Orientia chuto str. Dubai]